MVDYLGNAYVEIESFYGGSGCLMVSPPPPPPTPPTPCGPPVCLPQ